MALKLMYILYKDAIEKCLSFKAFKIQARVKKLSKPSSSKDKPTSSIEFKVAQGDHTYDNLTFSIQALKRSINTKLQVNATPNLEIKNEVKVIQFSK